MVLSSAVIAAEWKTDPSLYLKSMYNDNVRLRSEARNPEASTGYTLEPRVKFSGEELQRWDMSVDTRAKITRYQDINDGDSENVFFRFNGGRQTELTDWRLGANFRRNTNFDADFDTLNPDFGGLDDRTIRVTKSVTPSVSWSTSETSQLKLSFNATDISFEKASRQNYRDYTNNSVDVNAFWLLGQNHQLGFTSSYSEYDSPEAKFSYNQTVLQTDYTYKINPLSNISFSLGGRFLDSLFIDGQVVSCEPAGQDDCNDKGFKLEDLSIQNNGFVTNLTYSRNTERVSHNFKGGRTVSPSSYGGAQEILSATYKFSIKNTERFSSKLLLDVTDTSTLNGTLASKFNDRVIYRVEPSISYKLTKNWDLRFVYRYINRNYSTTLRDRDAVSNSLYVNLLLYWPKLASTY